MTLQTSYNKSGRTTYGAIDVNAANVDNAGRLEISNAIALGEYDLSKDALPLFFSQQTVGTGALAYQSTENGMQLSVASNADAAIYQTKQWHPYFPGHAQQPEFTLIGFTPVANTVKRAGYFNASTTTPFVANPDGFYLATTDSTVNLVIAKGGSTTTIAQSSWLDPLDGSGPSGRTINWANFNVFLIDFLYLGGTYVNLYWIAYGKRNLVHTYFHANTTNDVIVNTPAQPLRADITSSGGSSSFIFICGAVSTMGATGEFSGLPFNIDTGTSVVGCSTGGTEYAIIGVKKTLPNVEQFLKSISIASSAGAGETYRWRLHMNPTVTGTFTYSAVPDHYLERALGAGSATISAGANEGYIMASGMGTSRAQQTSLDISKALRIGMSVAGVYDELVLAYTPHQANQNMAATINGIMI